MPYADNAKEREYHKNYSREWARAHPGRRTEYYLKHKEQERTRHRAYYPIYKKRLKEEVLVHYGGGKLGCVLCGQNQLACLTIDHINGNGNNHRRLLGRQGIHFYIWLRKNSFPDGYQTLCMNCQFIKAFGG